MFNRPLLLLGILAAAVVVPYLLLDDKLAQTAKAQLGRFTGPSAPAKPADQPVDLAALVQNANSATAPPPAGVPLEEALRFDLTPEWITARWPQVTTVAGDIEHLGLRIAYVSGTQPSDVAGSLTYYFDEGHQLQRITLSGLSGDPARLAAIAGRFGLAPARTLEAGLYTAGDPAKPTSFLRITHLPAINTQQSVARVEVALDIRRSDTGRPVSANPLPAIPATYRRW